MLYNSMMLMRKVLFTLSYLFSSSICTLSGAVESWENIYTLSYLFFSICILNGAAKSWANMCILFLYDLD